MKKKKGLITKELKEKLKNSRNDRELLENLAIASKELDADDLLMISGGAQYEASDEQLKALIGNDSGLTEQTQAAIEALLNGGANVAATESQDTGTNDAAASLVNQKSGTDFTDATFTKVETAVFDEGTSGAVNLTGNDGITTELVNPGGLQLNMDSGDNEVKIDGGQASVITGDGNDVFNFTGDFKGQLESGGGDDTFVLDQDTQTEAQISVDAGDGFDLMRLLGKAIEHQFEFNGGKFHMK